MPSPDEPDGQSPGRTGRWLTPQALQRVCNVCATEGRSVCVRLSLCVCLCARMRMHVGRSPSIRCTHGRRMASHHTNLLNASLSHNTSPYTTPSSSLPSSCPRRWPQRGLRPVAHPLRSLRCAGRIRAASSVRRCAPTPPSGETCGAAVEL